MADSISVRITADVTDLAAQFAVAKAESSALSQELNRLAKQAASTGLNDELKAQLDAAAESMLQAKAKTAELSAQLKEAQGTTQSFGTTLTEATGVLGQFGVALSVAAAVNFGKDSLEYAANIEHMSEVLGLSTDDLQAFQFAARDSGVAVDDADTIIRRFMSNLGGLADNAGPAVKAVHDLGLNAQELEAAPAQALVTIAQRLLEIQDPAQRARIETELFGRSGEDLNAMLGKLAGGFDDMKQKASDAGQMLGNDTTKNAEKADNALSNLWATIKGLTAETVAWVVTNNPFIEELNDTATAATHLKGALSEIENIGVTGDVARRDADEKRDLEQFAENEKRKTEIAKEEAKKREEAYWGAQKAYEGEVSATLADAQRTLEEMQRTDVENTNDYIEETNKRLAASISELDREYSQHKISAQQKHDAEVELTQEIRDEVLKQLDVQIAGLTEGTKAWRDEMKKRADLVTQYNSQIQKYDDQLVSEEMQKWTQLGNSITSSVGSAFKELVFQGRSWQQAMFTVIEGIGDAFFSMGEKWVENWIEQQLEAMFITKSTQAATATSQISSAAGVAGANMLASFSLAPWPIDMGAPAAGAAAATEAMSFTSFVALAEGTNYIPRDMPAFLHKGEAVVPARYNNTMNGGHTFVTNYNPSWSGRDQITPQEFFRKNQYEIVGELKRLVRNGALAF